MAAIARALALRITTKLNMSFLLFMAAKLQRFHPPEVENTLKRVENCAYIGNLLYEIPN
jgi:hypothetical protein